MYVVEAERARGSKRSTLQPQIKAKVLKSHCIGHVSFVGYKGLFWHSFVG